MIAKQLIKKSCLYIKNAHNQGYMLFLYFHFFQLFNYWLVSILVIFHIHTAHSYADDFYNIRYLNKQNFLQEMEKKRSSRMELNEFESKAREGGKKRIQEIYIKFDQNSGNNRRNDDDDEEERERRRRWEWKNAQTIIDENDEQVLLLFFLTACSSPIMIWVGSRLKTSSRTHSSESYEVLYMTWNLL